MLRLLLWPLSYAYFNNLPPLTQVLKHSCVSPVPHSAMSCATGREACESEACESRPSPESGDMRDTSSK